jgi:hypothetical protein
MRKYAILLAALAVVLMAGCEGDDPGGAGGTLPTVTGLTISDTSEGRDIVLTWTEVDEAENYEIYFNTSGTPGSGDAVTTTEGTTYTHTAESAGYYSVRAKSGDNYSESFATAVNTMPQEVSGPFQLVDQYGDPSVNSGFYFGTIDNGQLSGYTTNPVSSSNIYDLYAYDDQGQKGDGDVKFYAGNYGSYGGGYNSDFYATTSDAGYAPGSGWAMDETSLLSTGDYYFVKLYFEDADYYARVHISDVSADTSTPNGTFVTIGDFEFQTLANVRVF